MTSCVGRQKGALPRHRVIPEVCTSVLVDQGLVEGAERRPGCPLLKECAPVFRCQEFHLANLKTFPRITEGFLSQSPLPKTHKLCETGILEHTGPQPIRIGSPMITRPE